ncbi:MAG: Mammalian cell entry related domain protein, partial [Solirubrobacterales bacterium]|nr:Mammalian cell entry related domain protein [Solirubrobacterales bacterium]
RNAHASLRPITALQDMYVDITDRGTPSAGLATARTPLPLSQTDTAVNVRDVLQVFTPDRRSELAQLLDGLGNGLADRGTSLRQAFVELVPFLRNAGQLSKELADRAVLTRQLVHNFATLTGQLGERSAQLRQLVADGGATLKQIEAGATDLNATLRDLPAFLTQADSSFATVQTTLPNLDGALRALGPVADRLGSGLDALRSFGAAADPALLALRTPVKRLVPLADSLRPFAAKLASSATNLLPQVPDLNHIVKDFAACQLGLYSFTHFTASLLKYVDSRGAYPRGDLIVDLNSLGGQTADPNTKATPGCTPGTPTRGVP